MFRNRILVIDDEPDSVYILRFALERAGFEVTTVGSARDAFPIAQKSEADLVLLDLVLSDGSGLDVCRALRADPFTRDLPIILVTGKLRTEFDTVEGFKAGADDYIMKPFRPAEVVARVETLLERTRRLRDASPSTGLPGPLVIQTQLQRLLAKSGLWALLAIDLSNFRIYNELYGFERGDDVLRAVADCITKAVQVDSEHFIGHAGGDSFIVTTTPEHMEDIAHTAIAAFSKMIGDFYPPEATQQGYVIRRSRRGDETQHPLVAMSIAGVSNEQRTFHNPLEISAVAGELKIALRPLSGSNYIKDRRTVRM